MIDMDELDEEEEDDDLEGEDAPEDKFDDEEML